jgi:hypothetical protein
MWRVEVGHDDAAPLGGVVLRGGTIDDVGGMRRKRREQR